MILEREEGRETDRQTSMWERNINWLSLICSLIRDQTSNLGVCPHQELNLQNFGVWDDIPTNWAILARANSIILSQFQLFYPSIYFLRLSSIHLQIQLHALFKALLLWSFPSPSIPSCQIQLRLQLFWIGEWVMLCSHIPFSFLFYFPFNIGKEKQETEK